jgi:hypothetical protein
MPRKRQPKIGETIRRRPQWPAWAQWFAICQHGQRRLFRNRPYLERCAGLYWWSENPGITTTQSWWVPVWPLAGEPHQAFVEVSAAIARRSLRRIVDRP